MPRDRLIDQILEHLLLMGSEVDRLTGAAAAFNQINRTDLRAQQVLRGGGMTAGQLARALHVTSGATTRVIDSMVAAGHARREDDPTDRRRVLIMLSPDAERILDNSFEQLRAQARLLLESYQDEELETVARFMA